MNRPVRLREEDSDDGSSHQTLTDHSAAPTDLDDSNADDSMSYESDFSSSSVDSSQPNNAEAASLGEISFGALAQAQAQAQASSNPRKRKAAASSGLGTVHDEDIIDDTESSSGARKVKQQKTQAAAAPPPPPHRPSKHAPTMLSSKTQVSRARTILDPSPALKSRDPRFDAAVQQHSTTSNTSASTASKNYSFLTSYQEAEILALRGQIKAAAKAKVKAKVKAKDDDDDDEAPSRVAALKRQVMSLEAKVRNAQTRQRGAEIRAAHTRQERAALAEGRKGRPYYLKESAVRRQVADERRESMGKRARDKADRRRLKRDKTRAAREMPRVRRGGALLID